MKNSYDIILKPVITEASMDMLAEKKLQPMQTKSKSKKQLKRFSM